MRMDYREYDKAKCSEPLLTYLLLMEWVTGLEGTLEMASTHWFCDIHRKPILELDALLYRAGGDVRKISNIVELMIEHESEKESK